MLTSTSGRIIWVAEGKAPMRRLPVSVVRAAASDASARSSSSSKASAWATNARAVALSRTCRPVRSSSGSPASRSSAASCWDTAEGV
jgi:hypothetical protein